MGYITIAGLTLNDLIIYYGIALLTGYFYVRVEKYLSEDVSSGRIINYLTKNINPLQKYYFEIWGWDTFAITIIFFITIILTIIFNQFNLLNVFLFILFLIFGAIINALFFGIIGLLSFKIYKVQGILMNVNILVSFLSGNWLPLNFFPISIQNIFFVLPFQYMQYFPAMIILNKVEILKLLFGFAICIAWILILYLLFNKLYKMATKSFEGQGG